MPFHRADSWLTPPWQGAGTAGAPEQLDDGLGQQAQWTLLHNQIASLTDLTDSLEQSLGVAEGARGQEAYLAAQLQQLQAEQTELQKRATEVSHVMSVLRAPALVSLLATGVHLRV